MIRLPKLTDREFEILSNALWFYAGAKDKPIDHTINLVNTLRVKLGCLDNWNAREYYEQRRNR